jgi:putative DNA primase/helicase
MNTNADDATVIRLDAMRELEEPRPPEFSDESLALRFAELHANDLRYVAAWGRWLLWDGIRWQIDNTLAAYNLVRKVCRVAAAQCNKGKVSSVLASAKTVAAVERLAKADRRIAATVDQWDTDHWVLNTPSSVIDLRTGEQYPHRSGAYITKRTAVAPDGNCVTPTWDAFLDRVTGGDAELVAFLKRMAGYALTGLTHEHALFFLYGIGANGKKHFHQRVDGCCGRLSPNGSH